MSEPEPFFVHRPPTWKNLRVPVSFDPQLPVIWLGEEIHWETPPPVRAVFIKQFPLTLPDKTIEVFLFGSRFELAGAVVNGKRREKDGYFVVFETWEISEDLDAKRHQLAQHRSPTYAAQPETDDDVPAREVRHPEQYSVMRPPVWKKSDAYWPKSRGEIMTFLGQSALPETPVTRQHLTWDESVFLFFSVHDSGLVFKLTTQSISGQTAEEHYALEEQMWNTAQSANQSKRSSTTTKRKRGKRAQE